MSDTAAGQLGGEQFQGAEQFEDPIQVFPRIRERDSYRLLGLAPDALFDEVQDARNFLSETYKRHERSRESIEAAYENILVLDMKKRQKFGFQPPKTGRRTDVQGDAERLSPIAILKSTMEPSVPSTTIVNDGVVFVLLGAWCAWMSAAHDPTLPLGAAICYCTWRLFDKRKIRNPDGPFFGNSPVFGALGTTLLGLAIGGVASWLVVQYLPLPSMIRPEGLGVFLINMVLAALCIFFK